jgi:hypothetical protein
VQGDLPEVPAEAVLKHAGPLQLSKLPAHLIPKFEPVPGPVETSGPYLYMHHQAREYAALMMESRAELSAAD